MSLEKIIYQNQLFILYYKINFTIDDWYNWNLIKYVMCLKIKNNKYNCIPKSTEIAKCFEYFVYGLTLWHFRNATTL